ncbi:hypothetical protein N7510_000907 [Penicillium lagena]|uniref:uncharacterized protein n=1 Tax=Penicillium lagena TaxID=94218 RepID=UPI002541038D|nr:uncharacterized protein N7510_000907 [Penicillium lagena]KAJ5624598.1 hypothetical protein N7510_000907 [Penicillium lagena]
MAHQAHNIPWSLLTSNLYWNTHSRGAYSFTNLRPRMKPNQGKELTYFIKAFTRTIDEHSVCERNKYPSTYDPADPADVILDAVTVQKITPTVRRWRSYGFEGRCPSGICLVAQYKEECQCVPIPDEEKRVSAFIRHSGYSRQCYQFFIENSKAFFNVEVMKTLLLHGEMDAILRACALPGVCLEQWWRDSQCQCLDPDLGWDQVCIKALRAYICLNTIYCKPEIWDDASGRTQETDYRNSKFYQFTLRTCTGTGQTSDVSTYPHRQFFGIYDDQFRGEYLAPRIRKSHWLCWADIKHHDAPDYSSRRANHYGRVPINEFLVLENVNLDGHRPGRADVALVQDYLYRIGLPPELVLYVMELAGYEPLGRLSEPHDPFHPSNHEELGRYLTYCWRVLVNCDMMAKALGMELPWEELLGDCIVDFWADDICGRGKFFWQPVNENYDILPKVFLKP